MTSNPHNRATAQLQRQQQCWQPRLSGWQANVFFQVPAIIISLPDEASFVLLYNERLNSTGMTSKTKISIKVVFKSIL